MEPSLLATAKEFISEYWPHVSGGAVAAAATVGTAIFAYIRRPKSSPTEAGPYFTEAALLSPPLTRPAYSDRMAYVLAEMSDLAYYQFEGPRGFVDDAVENAMSLDLTDDTNVREFLEKFSTELMSGRRLQLGSMKKVLSNSGFSLLDVIDINETQGFACKRIAENEPPYLVLAFRGTEKKISDWLTDARCVRFLKTPVYRIANSSDIVPRVPPGAGMMGLVLLVQGISWLTRFAPLLSAAFDKLEELLDKLNGYRHFGDLRYLSDVAEGRFDTVRPVVESARHRPSPIRAFAPRRRPCRSSSTSARMRGSMRASPASSTVCSTCRSARRTRMSSGRSVQAPSPIAARQPATLRSTFARPPHSSHSVPSRPCVSMRASAMAWLRLVVRRHVVLPCRKAAACRLDGSPPNPSRSALRPLASTPDGCTSGVRPTLRDEGRSSAAGGRAREQREPRKRRRDGTTRRPKGARVARSVAGGNDGGAGNGLAG